MARVTQEHVEARNGQILDAAWICFARKGYYETTMQDIADEAGLSAGAIYRYFPSKDAVLRAINDRSQETGRALVQQARSLAGGPLDAMRIIGEAMLSLFNDPDFEATTRVNVEIWPHIMRDQRLREGYRTELSFWHRVISDLLADARARGQFLVDVEPEALASLYICAWEGFRHYALIDPERFHPEILLTLTRSLITGMTIDEPTAPPSPGIDAPPWRMPASRRHEQKENPDGPSDS
ncbi:MAG: TetR/AcrR family transcriptional regulator [Dehalococcoidia bacterium]